MPKACWWWLLAAALVSCTRAPAPPIAAPPEVAAPVSLDEVMRRTHFAFWPEGAGFAGGHDTYLARVEGSGLALHLGAGATPTLRLAATTLGRGVGEPVALAGVRRRQDGVLLREGPGVTEVLENTERGLEQSWRFERPLPGEGDLVVRVPVEAGAAATVTERGLRFAGPGGAFTYGHGTWIDAEGHRTPVPATFSGGAIVLRVPAEVLGRGGYPAVLDPLIAPELDVEPASLLPAWGSQDMATVAFNGSVYLVVWQDLRTTASAFATRVAPDGSILDPWGIMLGLGNATSRPTVASDGSDFLVVVADGNQQIRGVRVGASGEVLAPGLIVYDLATWTPTEQKTFSDPALAWTGSHYVLVNVERRSDPASGQSLSEELVGWLIRPTGELASRVELTRFEGGPSAQLTAPQLSHGNNVLLVAYRYNSSTVRALRFGLDLTPLDLTPVTVGGAATAHSVAWDGQRFVVAWSSSSGLNAARVTLSGAVLDPVPLRFTSAAVSSFAMAADPAGVTVLWVQSVNGVPSLFAARLAPSGAISSLGTAVATFPVIPVQPTLARGSGAFLLVWRASVDGTADIFGLRLSAQLAALDPGPLRFSGSAARQQQLSLAWNGRHYLATWLDYRRTQQAVVATRLARDGTPMAPLATQLSPTSSSINRPAVATNGDDWFVAWSQTLSAGHDVLGVRVGASGEALDDAGVVLVADPGDQLFPSIGWLGDEYLVVFDDRPTSTSSTWDVRAVAVGRDGRPRADGGLVISAAPDEQSAPRVAAHDGGAFVVWHERRDGGAQIRGARIAQGPALLDPVSVFVTGGGGSRGSPNVAAGPEGFVLCWSEYSSNQLMSARVDRAGVLRGTARLNPLAPADSCFATWDGEDYVVGWSQWRTGPVSFAVLAARWVSFDGGVGPDAGLLLAQAPDASVSERITAIASPGRRQFIVGFSAEVLADAGYVARARTRVVTRGEPPVAAPASATTSEDVAVTVPLSATDPDGDAVVFVVAAQPDAGLAIAVDGGVAYQPAPDFHGTDRFLVRADDGALFSSAVEVEVVVTPVDDAPVAAALSLEVDEDETVPVPVPARDVDDEALSFAVVEAPSNGALSGQPPGVVYAPAADFSGTDTFTYALSDGRGTSTPARVTVLVKPVADAPVAPGATVTTPEDTPVDVPLAATDADGDALSFEVLDPPANGALEGTAPALRFVPAADFHGEDRFTFRVTDGTSAVTAEVRFVVEPVNDAPVAAEATLAAVAGTALPFSLSATDPEGDALSFQVLADPAHGTLTGEAPALTYSPASDFEGEDELLFAVTDAAGATASGRVRFVVAGALPPPPSTSCGCGATGLEFVVALAALLGRRRAVIGRHR